MTIGIVIEKDIEQIDGITVVKGPSSRFALGLILKTARGLT